MSESARLNARLAVERDPVRLRELLDDYRLAAAVRLAPRIIVAEALLAGVTVPASRLKPVYRTALDLRGGVVLDDALALAVLALPPEDADGNLGGVGS